MTSKNLAVLGHPIDHSLSPVLHAVAYDVLGLDWAYGRQDLTEDLLADYVTSRDESWVGLSLTMPLKYRAAELADVIDEATAITGACNTLVFDHDTNRLNGFNTDVPALASVITDVSDGTPTSVSIVGGGATAVSGVVAAARAGAQSVDLYLRDTSKAGNAIAAAQACSIALSVHPLDRFCQEFPQGISVVTLPGSVDIALPASGLVDSVLLDVAYSPWPTLRARAWSASGGHSVSGLHMLVRQALLQVRLFVGGGVEARFDREGDVIAAMRESVGLEELR
jgi:shikimate dehydrogenase